MFKEILRTLRPACVMLLVLSLLTGLVYPTAITLAAKALFPGQAEGSLIIESGKVMGSELLGQQFSDPGRFWGRPSATTPQPYNASASGGSNLTPAGEAQLKAVRERVEALRQADPGNTAPVPADLVTASASGLDPHISPAAALFQVHRVALARGLSEDLVRELVARQTKGRTLGFLGEPRVNVLLLNRALDREALASGLAPAGASAHNTDVGQ
ncbi:MAG: potassium-transporting ATPase subunit KdpC [Humidesulfovibrio sp.]|nr:potassium-transporting ATPase subunit KdpC [Humidesulfovibrio sp.]